MSGSGRLFAAGPGARHSCASTPGPIVGPVRTCVGCRSTGSRSVLVRVVASVGEGADPELVVDTRGCLPGRGAWLHPDPACLELAERRRAFARALHRAGPMDATAVHAYLAAQQK
ncbi:MAG: YlxR family protein [Cellulomonas sp.]|nr:YlxR family protein [Cellulomonas sp.]